MGDKGLVLVRGDIVQPNAVSPLEVRPLSRWYKRPRPQRCLVTARGAFTLSFYASW